jgi:hypothetical protein
MDGGSQQKCVETVSAFTMPAPLAAVGSMTPRAA